jgi:hypothetical protein
VSDLDRRLEVERVQVVDEICPGEHYVEARGYEVNERWQASYGTEKSVSPPPWGEFNRLASASGIVLVVIPGW